MALKIYGANGRASRTQWLIRYTGRSDIEVDTSFAANPGQGMKDEAKSKELEALHPNVCIPVLVDGDFVLTETCAIHMYLYLAKKKCNSDLAPKDLKEQALMNQYSFWTMTEVEADALRTMFTGIGRVHPDFLEGGGPEKVASNLARPMMKAFETWITGKGYLVGGRFTVADLNVANVMDWLVRGKGKAAEGMRGRSLQAANCCLMASGAWASSWARGPSTTPKLKAVAATGLAVGSPIAEDP